MMISNFVNKIMVGLLVGAVAACSPTVEHKNVEEVTTEQPTSTLKEFRVGDQLPDELVCMVNNAYMGKLQIPVKVMDKTYYGCCEMCKTKLNEDENARTSRDPFSGKMVDKSEAYIVLLNTQGEVAYFESEESYKDFIQK